MLSIMFPKRKIRKHEWLCYLKGHDSDGGVRIKATAANVAVNLFLADMNKDRKPADWIVSSDVEVVLWSSE